MGIENSQLWNYKQNKKNFRRVGLSVLWGDYIVKSPAFKDELESLSRSDMFQMAYFKNIKAKKLVQNLKKGDAKMTPYIMPLFMMHIWIMNYVEKFSTVSAIIK